MDRPDPPTSGAGPGGRHLEIGRAIAVILAAVVLGVVILRSGGGPGVVALPGGQVTGSTTTVPRVSASTSTTVSHTGVKVLVANASTTNGVAGGYSTALQHAGWTVLPPVTAKAPAVATSSVYYAANKRSEADAVAAALGVPVSAVLPLSPATPVTGTTGADVVVIVGFDLAAKTPPSTVPPTTTPKTTHKTTTTTTKAKTTTSTTAKTKATTSTTAS